MKDLKCGFADCTHNRAYCCCAKKIQVNAETDCETYAPSQEKKQSLFEAGEDFVKRNYSVDTEVRCGAQSCLFNKNELCYANGITVMGDEGQEAICASYLKQ